MSIWKGEIGNEYNALNHSFEENIIILGRHLAEQVEILKLIPDVEREMRSVIIKTVCLKRKIITIGVE